MNTTSHPDTRRAPLSRLILSQDDIDCTLLALPPGEETACEDAHWTQEHLLFVIEGSVHVHAGAITMLVNKDDALHVPPGKDATIAADTAGWAKVLRVDFKHRTTIEPAIFTLPETQPFASTR